MVERLNKKKCQATARWPRLTWSRRGVARETEMQEIRVDDAAPTTPYKIDNPEEFARNMLRLFD